MSLIRKVLVHLLVILICAYQVGVRPLLVGSCKFHPSCSEYAVQVLRTHGPIHGFWLAIRRLARCHPWSLGGVDPAPPRM